MGFERRRSGRALGILALSAAFGALLIPPVLSRLSVALVEYA